MRKYLLLAGLFLIPSLLLSGCRPGQGSSQSGHASQARTVQHFRQLGYDVQSEAAGINASGQVVGTGVTNDHLAHAFLWTPSSGFCELGSLSGRSSVARGINASGQVVGSTNTPEKHSHAFLWTAEKGMQDLGTLGGNESYAEAINDAGQVVGKAMTKDNIFHAFLWTADKGMQDLGTLFDGKGASDAHQINTAGQVVGTASAPPNGSDHAFLWSATTGMQDIGAGEALAINDAGQVTGGEITRRKTHKGYCAYLWSASSGLQDIGPTDCLSSTAKCLNAHGQVLVESAYDQRISTVCWTSAGMTELGTLGGQPYCAAAAINEAGQVVGSANAADGKPHAFIWSASTGMHDLNEY